MQSHLKDGSFGWLFWFCFFRFEVVISDLSLLDSLFFLSNPPSSSNVKQNYHQDNKSEANNTPNNDIVPKIGASDPKDETNHDSQSCSDNTDNEDRVLDNLAAGEGIIVIWNRFKVRLVGSHLPAVFILLKGIR